MFKLKEEYLISSNNKNLGKLTVYSEVVTKSKDFETLDDDNSYIEKRLHRLSNTLKIKKGLKR